MSERRNRSFAVTVLLGLAGAALAAVAGTRVWAEASGDAAGIKVAESVTGAESAPLVGALSLVTLAAWGVVLVVRGQARRVVAGIGLLAGLGVLAAVVLGFGDAQHDALAALRDRGATGDVVVTGQTGWYYLSGVGALGTAVAFALAVVWAPGWPAMGSRYDAPGTRPSEPAASEPASEEDLWRAMNHGRDPTS